MKLCKLIRYSDKLLIGVRMRALLVSLMFVGTEFVFRLAEAALYSIILYFEDMKPIGLFTGDSSIQKVSAAVCMILRYLATAPLIYACVYWFAELCSDNSEHSTTQLSNIILNKKLYGRSLTALIFSKVIGFAFLIPTAFFGATAISLVQSSVGNSADARLFMAMHASVMTLASVVLWIWAKIAMITLPFLLIKFPKRSVFSCIRDSFSFVRGRRSIIVKLFLLYVPLMLPVVTIPWILPKLFSSVALCISIGLKEDEYRERNKNDSNLGKAHHTSRFSSWSKRRLTPSADKAQAAGYGDNS